MNKNVEDELAHEHFGDVEIEDYDEINDARGKSTLIDLEYFDKEFPNVQQLICTLGPKGVLILDEGKLYNFYSAEANVIDKTGAGDFFAAGYLFGLQNGLTISESADIANKSAAHVISEIGVRPKYKFV